MGQAELNQEDLLRRIVNRIRQSLELQEILTATVAQVRAFLGTDRVIVYRFHEFDTAQVIAESIQDRCLPSLKGLNILVDDIPEKLHQIYLNVDLCSIADVTSGLIGCLPVDWVDTDAIAQRSYPIGAIAMTPDGATRTVSGASRESADASLEQAFVPTVDEKLEYRPLDPWHAAYLSAMGVQSSIVLPIVLSDSSPAPLDRDGSSQERLSGRLWGLLVSHHSKPRAISRKESHVLRGIVEQVAVAIAQSNLLAQVRQQHFVEATTNRVSTRLHSMPTIELQAAVEDTVIALKGCGGRLFIAPEKPGDAGRLCVCGTQPTSLDGKHESFIEQHPIFSAWALSRLKTKDWRERGRGSGEAGEIRGEFFDAIATDKFRSTRPIETIASVASNPTSYLLPPYPQSAYEPLFVTDLYKVPELRVLTLGFQSTPIRGMLVLPLFYRSSLLGYLSIFRAEINTETLWEGRFDPNEKQRLPRQSFEAWRELMRGRSPEWTTHDVELAIALGHHFAMAIVQYKLYSLVQSLNTNLERQVEERTAKLQQVVDRGYSLERVTNQIRSTLNLKIILETIVREVRNLLDTDRVVIYRFADQEQGEVIVEAIKGEWNSVLGIKGLAGCFPDESSFFYTRGQIRVINDVSVAEIAPCHRDFLQSLQIKANLIVPIGVTNELWGLLIAQECQAPRVWHESEISLLQQLASQAAIAIKQAELYEQSRTAAATATGQAQQLSLVAKQQQALFGVVTKIRESLDVKTIFTTATTEVRRLLSADRVAVFRFMPDSDYDDGEVISEDVRPGFPQTLRMHIHDRCFGDRYAAKYHLGRIQAVPDIYNAGLSDCHIELLAQFQVRANLVVPILKGGIHAGDKPLLWGLFCIHQCTGPRQWNTCDIDFVSQIAAHLGVALQQAELLAKTQQQAEQLAIAFQNLKQTQSQLIQTEKMSSLGQLVAGIAHEINNPVNFIYGNLSHTFQYANDLLALIQLYQRHYPNPEAEIVEQSQSIDLEFLKEDFPKILNSLQLGTDRIRKLVLSLRNFSRLDQAEMKLVDIHEGIDSTLLILQHRLKVKASDPGIEVVRVYGDLPLVECYASQLNQVFMNVLSNAIDALEEYNSNRTVEEILARQSQITISTSIRSVRTPTSRGEISGQLGTTPLFSSPGLSDSAALAPYENPYSEHVVIRIADNGPGISPALQSQIFDPFFTTKPIGKGTGLGLSISYQIVVEKHGGIFKCVSQPGQGTEFWIGIPIRQLKLAQLSSS
ncbi:MAG TPA: GAF domain-containing protein [Chroococcales cyanobacterium]